MACRQESSTMLKAKERPASADALHRATSPTGRRDKGQGRSSTASGTSTMRAATRMFRQAEDSPSPSRKNGRGSPSRSPTRQASGMTQPSDRHLLTTTQSAPVSHGTTVIVAGKGTEVDAPPLVKIHIPYLHRTLFSLTV
jgi:DnaJ-class molecular chaperone